MFHKGLSFDELMGMDIESFGELMTRIKENNTKTSSLTDAEREMIDRTKRERVG